MRESLQRISEVQEGDAKGVAGVELSAFAGKCESLVRSIDTVSSLDVPAIYETLARIPLSLTPAGAFAVQTLVLDLLRALKNRSRIPPVGSSIVASIVRAGSNGAEISLATHRWVQELILQSRLSESLDQEPPADQKCRIVADEMTDNSALASIAVRWAEAVLCVVGPACEEGESGAAGPGIEQHALVRWARVVAPIAGAPNDLRTVDDWGRFLYVSPGAIRNWCGTAGIAPRRSLVFGRLLRAARLREGGHGRPENLLNFVDRRTLEGLMRYAGLNQTEFPRGWREYLAQQTLVTDRAALLQIERLLDDSK